MWYRSCYEWSFLDLKPSYVPFMIQKRSCSLSAKVNWIFCNMIKICLIVINNVNMFTIYESLPKNFKTILPTIHQNKTKMLWGKWAWKWKWILIIRKCKFSKTVRNLFEHYFWQNWLKFYDKMDLSSRLKVIYNVKNC